MSEQFTMTTEELRILIQNIDPEHQEVDDDKLIWFVCIQEAYQDFSLKDLAHMFLNGIRPKTFEDVQGWLDTTFEDLGDIQESLEFITNQVKIFHGVPVDDEE